MGALRCFGCHGLLDGDADASRVSFGVLCDACAAVGQVASIGRRPRPCDCPHCVHWRRAA